jgi:hypothetical protein
MCQEAEQGVWKPVVATLGVASVLLSIVGNLVFSPDSLLKKGESATGGDLAATSFPQSLDLPRADSEPVPVFQQAIEPSSIPILKLANAQHEPQAGLAPQAEPAAVAELAPQAELLPQTDETVVPILPRKIELPHETALPRETATDVSVADVRPDTDETLPDDVREQHPHTVAVAEPSPPVVPQMLSHHDRKVLRKVTRLEKKKNRLVKDGRSIVRR